MYYRKNGIERNLLEILIAEFQETGLDFVEPKTTDSGYNLYKSIGFKDLISKYDSIKYTIDTDNKF